MKLRLLALTVLMVGSVFPARAQDAMKVADELGAKWQAAYNSGDAAAIAALFTTDAVFNAPSGAALSGHEAIEKAIGGRIKAGWTNETVTVKQASMMGNVLWAVGDYAITGSGENAGKQTGGKFGEVLVRDGDAWHIVMLTANTAPPKQ